MARSGDSRSRGLLALRVMGVAGGFQDPEEQAGRGHRERSELAETGIRAAGACLPNSVAHERPRTNRCAHRRGSCIHGAEEQAVQGRTERGVLAEAAIRAAGACLPDSVAHERGRTPKCADRRGSCIQGAEEQADREHRERSVRSAHERPRTKRCAAHPRPGRSSVKPAAEKSSSNASADDAPSSRMVANEVASTHENSRSSRRRSHCSAPASAFSDTRRTSTRGECSRASRNATAAAWPARRRRNVHVSPRTSFVVISRSCAWLARSAVASSCRLSRSLVSATQNDVSTKIKSSKSSTVRRGSSLCPRARMSPSQRARAAGPRRVGAGVRARAERSGARAMPWTPVPWPLQPRAPRRRPPRS